LWLDGLGAQTSFNFAAITVLVGAAFILFIPKINYSQNQ